MGLNDMYQPSRSNLLARDPLPDVKDAFAVVFREESHRGLAHGKITAKTNPAAFVAKTNNGNNNFNNNIRVNSNNIRVNSNNNSNRGPNPNPVCKHCGLIGHTIERCYELNGYPAGFKRNTNLSKQSGFVKKFNGNNVDASQCGYTSSGSMTASFTNDQMLKLLCLINEKLAANVSGSMADSKYFVGFDESTCYIQDLRLGKIMETGSETAGLYMFDYANNGKPFAGLCNYGIVCFVSKELWHCRLGHPTDQVLSVLSDQIGFKTGHHVSAYDICHKAKQTRELFSLSDHKSVKLRELIHLDVWGAYKVTSRDGFFFDIISSQIPNDEKGDTSKEDVSHEEMILNATQIEKNVTSKGNSQNFSIGEGSGLRDEPQTKLDVNNAFFCGDLNEEVCMALPLGYYDKNETKVCKLVMYGLKQAPRQWNAKLTSLLIENGFIYSKNDYSLYVKSKKGLFVALSVYVDDIVITQSDLTEIESFKRFLSSKFMIKDLGELKYFLGIVVLKNQNGICLSQRKYCLELLRLRVLRYLKQAPGTGVQFNRGNMFRWHALLDADWAKCLKIRKSVSGFCVYFCNNLVSLKSKKQATISRSSAEYLYCDSSAAIEIANPVFHEKTKYFEIGLHPVREKVSPGVIRTLKIGYANNVADVFTKRALSMLNFVKDLEPNLYIFLPVCALIGGRTKIKDVKNNQEVQELGKYSVEENNRKVGSNGLKFVEVVKAESQVVSGTKYYLTIKAISSKGGKNSFFDAEIVVKPWLHSKELVSFRPGKGTN
uniref:Ribonuclease H-like domain-containing protein n=1 Tax=Tanacetum cinerariifolium TaxID=118510 RepID=A0A6L2M7T4_TANCI|nr:ribonuclease H-like domain-containing protein [Tanacetum cinerariifolium]